MAKIDRYDGNLKAFASEQLGSERTLFGQLTSANDLTSQITAEFLRGWGVVGPSDQPSLQDFNAAMYTNGQLIAYLHQMGVAEYNAAQEYFIGSVTQAGGEIYISLTDGNVGNAPSSSPAQWRSATTVPDATTTVKGIAQLATQAEAEAGTDNAKISSPLRVFQALRSVAANATELLRGTLRIGTQAEVDAGVLDNVAVTPQKLSNRLASLPDTVSYVSQDLPMTGGGAFTLAHGLGVMPDLVTTEMICLTADGGYVPGDVVPFSFHGGYNNGSQLDVAVAKDSTAIRVKIPANGTQLANISTGVGFSITTSRWNFRVRARAWV